MELAELDVTDAEAELEEDCAVEVDAGKPEITGVVVDNKREDEEEVDVTEVELEEDNVVEPEQAKPDTTGVAVE